jgi:hypothetical protein
MFIVEGRLQPVHLVSVALELGLQHSPEVDRARRQRGAAGASAAAAAGAASSLHGVVVVLWLLVWALGSSLVASMWQPPGILVPGHGWYHSATRDHQFGVLVTGRAGGGRAIHQYIAYNM